VRARPAPGEPGEALLLDPWYHLPIPRRPSPAGTPPGGQGWKGLYERASPLESRES